MTKDAGLAISKPKVRWAYVLALSCSAVFLAAGAWTCWLIYERPRSIDFLSFWAAGRLAAGGHGAWAYDLNLHLAAERLAVPIGGLLPFAYLPPFLIVLAPFGIVPFWVSFALWVVVTAGAYALVVGRKNGWAFAMSHPSVLSNFMIGQNGFLTASLFSGGITLLSKRPWLGGAILGLLVIKPQLALLIPLAMLAGREWKAIVGGAMSASCALLVALALFGWDAYRGFAAALSTLTAALQESRWSWSEVASAYAFLRFFDVGQRAALVAQALIAILVAGTVCRAWWLKLDERGPILAAATVLTSPYLFTYDALLLAIPMLWLMNHRRDWWLLILSWFFCFLPVAYYFDLYPGPNTIPLAAGLLLWALHTPARIPRPRVSRLPA
jgi:hypothetical protein